MPIFKANFSTRCLFLSSGSLACQYIYKWVLTQRSLGTTDLHIIPLWSGDFVLTSPLYVLCTMIIDSC